jgi:hypothetical protein
LTDILSLQSQPIIELQYYKTTFIVKCIFDTIIVCIYQKYITHWSKSILQSAVYIKVVGLGIVLHKGSPEKVGRKVNFSPDGT